VFASSQSNVSLWVGVGGGGRSFVKSNFGDQGGNTLLSAHCKVTPKERGALEGSVHLRVELRGVYFPNSECY